MGTLTRVLPALLLAACAARAPVRDKGMTPASTTRDLLSQTLEPRRIALLIGVDDYVDPTFPDLRHAGADATALSELLAEAEGGGFDEVRVLTGRESTTRDSIVRALLELKETTRREDAVVVYFSGHGTRIHDGEHWRRFLLAADSRSSNITGTGFDLRELQSFFATLPPVRRSLILDACFHGDGKSVGRAPADGVVEEEPTPLAPSSVFMGAAESHLYATSAGRPAREDDRLGHGVYTHYLLESLSWGFQEADRDQDGVVTTWEAHDYARGRTIEHTGGVQVPEAAFRVIGEADLVLAGDPDTRRTQHKAQVYLYGHKGALTNASVVIDGRNRGVFPGAVPVEPGRHHVVLESDKRVLLEGYAKLQGGHAYRADHLVRVLKGPSAMVGARTAFVALPALDTSIGSGAPGVEGWITGRVNRGALRGFATSLSLGAGGTGSRSLPGQGPVADARSVVWGSAWMGYQNDVGQFRGRLGAGTSALVVPPDDVADPELWGERRAAAEAGWWVSAFGPTVGAGYTLFGRVAVSGEVRAHAASLDVNGTGETSLVPMVGGGIGIELGL